MMTEGAFFCRHVGLMDEDCVCVNECLSINYLSVSAKLDTMGWMTQ